MLPLTRLVKKPGVRYNLSMHTDGCDNENKPVCSGCLHIIGKRQQISLEQNLLFDGQNLCF